MFRQYKAVFASVTLAMGLALSGCGGDSSGGTEGELTTIKVIDPSAASDNLALLLGHNEGIFEKHGLKLELVSAPQVGANQVASLLNGQLDIGNGSVTGTMSAVSSGLPVRVVAALAADNEVDGRRLYETLVSEDSDIRTFKDLEGKTVALNSLKSTWQAAMSEAIAKDGGDPAKVKYVQLTFPNQIPALKQDQVDAAFTTQPFATQLLQDGYRSIGDPQAEALGSKRGVATIVQTSQAFIDKNPEAVEKFVAALQEASDYANANPDVVRKLAIEKAEASGAAAESISKSPLPFYTTEIDAETVEKWGSLMVKFGFAETAPSPSDVLWQGTKP